MPPTCQHCDGEVRWGTRKEHGYTFAGFVHVSTGLAACPAERLAEAAEDRAAMERYAQGLRAQERRDLAANRAEGISTF